MTRESHEITRREILPIADYAAIRKEKRSEASRIKKDRRVSVGPFATFYFENYDTMWIQIHEMLYIEKGGEAQIEDELRAYNPLIPNGRELVATLMFEIDDPARRDRELRRLAGVEKTVSLSVGTEAVGAVAETDVERTTPGGKTSSVHFVRFPLTDRQIVAFRDPDTKVALHIDHDNYGHAASMPRSVREALQADFD